MNNRKTFLKTGLITGVGLALVGGLLAASGVFAADHVEAPGTQADDAADITDFYAWHTEDDKLVLVVDFAGLKEAGSGGTYDGGVLYSFHIDVDADQVADTEIHARFGNNGEGLFGIQVLGLPGADADPFEGEVEMVHDAGGGAMVFAGPRDDPFFFDLDGYLATIDTEALAFDPDNDTFAGTNVTSIVLEMDLTAAVGDATQFQVWATTGRLP